MMRHHASPADNIERVRVVPGIATVTCTRDAERSSARLPRSASGSQLSTPTRQAVSLRGSPARATPVSARTIQGAHLSALAQRALPRQTATLDQVGQSSAGVAAWADADAVADAGLVLDGERERATQVRQVLDQRLTRRLSPAKVREVAQRQQDWEH
eukprot:COSAG02_NODE_14467_length_1268_cov_1.461933_1_plen_156_part_10